MTNSAIGRRAAAVACGAVLLLAGCNTNDGVTSPTTSGAASTTSVIAAPTTSSAGGGESAPAPTGTGGGATAPVTTASEIPAATPTKGGNEAASWDPCEIPDSALASAGLSVATERRRTGGSGVLSCGWETPEQTIELIITQSPGLTLEDLKQGGDFTDFTPVSIGGRSALRYRAYQDTHSITCQLSTAAGNGSIQFSVRNIRVQTDYGDECGDVLRLGNALAGYLP